METPDGCYTWNSWLQIMLEFYIIDIDIDVDILWNLDEALWSSLPGKQTKSSGVSATHCTQRGADCVCNTLVPETGPPFWKPFLLPAILRPRFWGQVFGAIFGTTKEQTGAARRSWRPGFRPFAGASLPSAMQAAMDTHTHIRIILWGDMAQKLFWISEKGPLSGAAEAMLTFCALAACRLYNAYVRKLFSCILAEVCGVQLLPCIPSARFRAYYSIRPKR